MLDQFLGWLVIFAPFLLSAVFILIPAKAENRTVHMRWRWGLLVFGLLFSGSAWWQQNRAATISVDTTNDAISKTSEKVAVEVKKADKDIIDAQNLRIDQLQKSLDAQGKDVGQIGASPFLTGKKPVRVEVTNPQSGNPTPIHQGHLTVSQETEVSTRPQFPYRIKVVIQSDIDFPSLKLSLSCNSAIGQVEGGVAGAGARGLPPAMFMSWVGVEPNTPTRWTISYSNANPSFGPANPITVDIYSANPISCLTASTN
jgi:hypothetical protein